MKKEFTKKWKSSKQPRKQRKFLANAPLHIKRKFLSSNLSKDLRKKFGKKNIPVRKGDKIKVLKGSFKNKEGVVNKVMINQGKIYVNGINIKKIDGSTSLVPLKASNIQIIELDTGDIKRIKSNEKTSKKENPKKGKTETKAEDTKKETKKTTTKKTKE